MARFRTGEVPADRIALLRKAYLDVFAMRRQKEEALKLGIDVDPVPWVEIQAMLQRLYASPPEIVQKARALAGR